MNLEFVFLGFGKSPIPNPKNTNPQFKITNWSLHHQLVISPFSSLFSFFLSILSLGISRIIISPHPSSLPSTLPATSPSWPRRPRSPAPPWSQPAPPPSLSGPRRALPGALRQAQAGPRPVRGAPQPVAAGPRLGRGSRGGRRLPGSLDPTLCLQDSCPGGHTGE